MRILFCKYSYIDKFIETFYSHIRLNKSNRSQNGSLHFSELSVRCGLVSNKWISHFIHDFLFIYTIKIH